MAQSKQALRARIKSVNSTKKITKAMEMIANAKLFRQRNRMEANREYAQRLQDAVNEMIIENPRADSPYLKQKGDSQAKLTVLFCSDLGLCGAYNQNVLKLMASSCRKEDPIAVIGTSLFNTVKEMGFHVIHDEPVSTDALKYDTLRGFIDIGLQGYLDGSLNGIQVVYTKFVNTMTFRPEIDTLLPATLDESMKNKVKENDGMKAETIFTPDAETILNELIPMMVRNVAYSDWMESSTAEQGSRRMAMKTASDNADELGEKLLLEYNKARQAAITQEITEIVGGSEAV